MENVYENVGSGRKGLEQKTETKSQLQITPKTVQETLEKMYTACTSGEAHIRIEEARENANKDAIETMRLVFPIVIEVKTQVLDELDLEFEKGQNGLKEFLKYANHYSHTDEGVREIFLKLRDLYLPRYQKPTNSSWEFTK